MPRTSKIPPTSGHRRRIVRALLALAVALAGIAVLPGPSASAAVPGRYVALG